MKVIIAAGGTGGHIYPGVAIAREFLRRDPTTQVRFVGTERGLESKIVPREGFRLELIQAGALNNVPWSRRIVSLAKMPVGFIEVLRLLSAFRPDIAIGVGGYASGAVMLTAALKRTPTLVVEPNALPGLANRVLARFVDAAAVTFAESAAFFPGKAILTGNPVRPEFENVLYAPRVGRSRVLIFGGSQGARPINNAMIEASSLLANAGTPLHITHQTGEADFPRVRDAYDKAGLQADVRPFIHDMADRFAEADLLICRSGATTVAEIAAAGKAAVFVPFPLAADDHQRKNAEVFERAGAGRMIVQTELTGKRLADEVTALLADPERISDMERNSRALARRGAAGAVVDVALRLVRRESIADLLIGVSSGT